MAKSKSLGGHTRGNRPAAKAGGRGRSAPKDAAGAQSAPAAIPGVLLSGLAPADLAEIRERIDAIDAEVHALLNARARFAQQVGISKSSSGKAVDFYRPEREAEVLRKALARNRGP